MRVETVSMVCLPGWWGVESAVFLGIQLKNLMPHLACNNLQQVEPD